MTRREFRFKNLYIHILLFLIVYLKENTTKESIKIKIYLCEHNTVVGVCTSKCAFLIIVGIAVSFGATILEEFWVISRPICALQKYE